MVGAVDKVKQILGMPISRPLELTTYKEASDMLTTLDADGVDNMIVRMTGWCNGGVEQQMLKDVDPIMALGSGREGRGALDAHPGERGRGAAILLAGFFLR